MERLQKEIKTFAVQGATEQEWIDAQVMKTMEEAGEFQGAYNRFRGFARREGPLADVTDELADVIISGFIMFGVLGVDAQWAIIQKLRKVITRGYVNKDG